VGAYFLTNSLHWTGRKYIFCVLVPVCIVCIIAMCCVLGLSWTTPKRIHIIYAYNLLHIYTIYFLLSFFYSATNYCIIECIYIFDRLIVELTPLLLCRLKQNLSSFYVISMWLHCHSKQMHGYGFNYIHSQIIPWHVKIKCPYKLAVIWSLSTTTPLVLKPFFYYHLPHGQDNHMALSLTTENLLSLVSACIPTIWHSTLFICDCSISILEHNYFVSL